MPRRDLSQLSRQRRWQLARIAEGRCSKCGKPLRHYPTMCDACALKNRRRMRALHGTSAWKPGGAGRPPIVVEPTRKRAKAPRPVRVRGALRPGSVKKRSRRP